MRLSLAPVILIAVISCCHALKTSNFHFRLRPGRTESKPHLQLKKLRAGAVHSVPALHDAAVSLLVAGESIIWLKIWTTIASKGWLDSKVTRKIIHTGSAPLFMAHWPLYTHSPSARVLAAAVPLIQVIRLYLAGREKQVDAGEPTKSSDLIKAVSRTGSNAEALGGPLIYSIVLLLGTAIFFRDSPVSIVAIAQMAAGDGLADIVGRRYGQVKWPFAPTKSLAGTCAFILGGFVVTAALLQLMSYTGVLSIDVGAKLPTLLLISVMSAMTELIPIVDDNVSVPLVAGLAAAYLL